MKRILNGSLLALILLCGSGCGTILNFSAGTEEGERSMIYGGVQIGGTSIWNMFSGESVHGLSVFWIGLLFIIDFPMTVVADTVTLPVTVGIELCGRPAKPKPSPKTDPK